MTTKAQARAKTKYKKEKTFRMSLEFYPPDQELIDKLQSVGNKQGYIKKLIEEDIKKSQ